MLRDSDIVSRTNWRDPSGRDQAKVIDWLWEMREVKDALLERAARNHAFYEGRQLHEWSSYFKQMILPGRYQRAIVDHEHFDHLIFNVVKPLLNQKLAKFSRSEPIWRAQSYTSDEFDQSVARFSNDLLGYYALHQMKIPRVNDQLIRHLFLSPVSFVEPYWNPVAGDPIHTTLDDFYRDARPMPDDADPDLARQIVEQNNARRQEDHERFQQMVGFQGFEHPVTQFTGDEEVRIRSVFDVMWYPFFVSDWSEVEMYLVSTVMTPEQIHARYKIPYDEISRHRNIEDLNSRHLDMIGSFNSPFMDYPELGERFDCGVLVHQLHVSKNITGPGTNGATAIKLGYANKAARFGELASANGKLPLYPISEHPGTTYAWGTCSMDDAVAPQNEINDALTKARKLRRDKVHQKIVRQKNDGGNIDAFYDDDSLYEVEDMNMRPQFLQLPVQGIEQQQAIEFAIRYLQLALAVPDVSLGRTAESDPTSGKAIQSLQAAANEALATTGKSLNALWSDVGSHVLADLQHYAVEDRLTGVLGENNRVLYRQWSAANLRPSNYAEYPDKAANVVVTTFSEIPKSPQEEQALLLRVLELKHFDDDPVMRRRVVARALGMEDIKSVFDPAESARNRASDNLRRWQQGERVPPPVHPQKHAEFIAVYEQFVDSDDFITLLQTKPQVAQEIVATIEVHKQYDAYNKASDIVRQQMAMAQASYDGAKGMFAQEQLHAAALLLKQSQNLGMNLGRPTPAAPERPSPSKQPKRDTSAPSNNARRPRAAEPANPNAAPVGAQPPTGAIQ